MVYQKYGITFKNMRKQNKFTLADFSEVGLASSTLSDFERGLTMISLEKIDLVLQLMGCSLSDFDSHLNFYSPTDPIYILQELERAILFSDSPKLKDLYITCKQTKQRNLCLTIKFLLKKGTLEEKNEIVNFLYETKVFGIKELSIFYIIMHQLAPQDILNIMKRLKQYGKGMSNSEVYHRHLSHVILEVITVLSNYGLKDEAYYFIKRVEELNLAQSMLLRNLFKAVKGLWVYNFENKLEGKEQIKKAMEILFIAAQPEVAQFHQEKFKILIDL
ncbi:Rgg/GadR/MutR family transcriptional regulator [Lactococcus garvieae]|uniref:Rgg/GadR/MutR family transcriptional regulator n=1 Tax=Lactococcus formosensis TaxID=1281486 RepID=UPI0013FDD4C6|nr:Rgg/GadR/MutR family transcriptional regulator [Lactococcus garvieae]